MATARWVESSPAAKAGQPVQIDLWIRGGGGADPTAKKATPLEGHLVHTKTGHQWPECL